MVCMATITKYQEDVYILVWNGFTLIDLMARIEMIWEHKKLI